MSKDRGVLGTAFLAAFSAIVILVLVYHFALINVNVTDYFKHVIAMNAKLANDKLSQLMNANSVVNLPHVNLVTDNADVKGHQKCKDGAIHMSSGGGGGGDNRALCKAMCGDGGKAIELHDGDEWYDNGRRLTAGAWCVTATARCNMRTGYVVATASGVACKTKFPNMFGGESAATVVACHNQVYRATGSVLYDYLRNEPVDPLTVAMTHEDELLPDGRHRFACKFSDDSHGNRYVANPLNRFHPMQNHCNKTLFRAHRSVTLAEDVQGWYCDCGEFNETRVRNADPRDRKSTCTSCYAQRLVRDDGAMAYKVPYQCFTQNSKYAMAASEFPCAGKKFTENGGDMCGTATIELMEVSDGDEETVVGVHSMPHSGVGFYGTHNVVRNVNWN